MQSKLIDAFIMCIHTLQNWITLIIAEHMCVHIIWKSVPVLAAIHACHNARADFLVTYRMHVMFM